MCTRKNLVMGGAYRSNNCRDGTHPRPVRPPRPCNSTSKPFDINCAPRPPLTTVRAPVSSSFTILYRSDACWVLSHLQAQPLLSGMIFSLSTWIKIYPVIFSCAQRLLVYCLSSNLIESISIYDELLLYHNSHYVLKERTFVKKA